MLDELNYNRINTGWVQRINLSSRLTLDTSPIADTRPYHNRLRSQITVKFTTASDSQYYSAHQVPPSEQNMSPEGIISVAVAALCVIIVAYVLFRVYGPAR